MGAPKGAVVLFDGRDLSAWTGTDEGPARWRIAEGALEVVPGAGDIWTRRNFRHFQLHLEFRVPRIPGATGQDRGNSGLYLLGRCELQILDSAGEPPAIDSCGAIYGVSPPIVNACRPALEWQTFEIAFRAPVLDSNGLVAERARVTVLHNGLVVQNNTCLVGPTAGALDAYEAIPGPIRLQDHGSPVQFRSVWILPGPDRVR